VQKFRNIKNFAKYWFNYTYRKSLKRFDEEKLGKFYQNLKIFYFYIYVLYFFYFYILFLYLQCFLIEEIAKIKAVAKD